jgi:adenylate cyclase
MRRLPVRVLLAIAALLTAPVLVLTLTDALRQLELKTVDARFSVRGSQGPPRDVALVLVDDVTFDELPNDQWPFRRSLHGRVIDRLREAGARVIAYDVQFTEQTTAKEDDALINAVDRAHGKVVLATTEVNQNGESAVFGGEDTVRSVGARVGNALLPPDADGVDRRVPHTVEKLTSFAVASAEVFGHAVPRFGDAWIDYRGPPGTVPTLSFSRVLHGDFDPALVRGKVVVVGAGAPSLQDVHPTSVGRDELMAGAEIHANAISTVLDGLPLSEAPRWVAVVLVLLVGVLGPLLWRRLRGWRALLALAAVVLYVVVAQLAFGAGLILPVVYPLLAAAVAAAGVLVIATTAAAYEREHVRERFARFVPAGVVDDALARAEDDLRLGGVRVEATVIFCDLRAFSTFSEHRPPEEAIAVINRYLEEMSEPIRSHGGTLLRYSGDGILAMFGAPIEQADHADRALAAVREMAGPRLSRLNAWVREQGLGDGFEIGIGVNSGEVMCGHVGSEWRVEYTAVGDPVNTASRLEAMTKDFEHAVLVAETTRERLVREVPDLVFVDSREVRGRQAKASLWTLDGRPQDRQMTGSQTV